MKPPSSAQALKINGAGIRAMHVEATGETLAQVAVSMTNSASQNMVIDGSCTSVCPVAAMADPSTLAISGVIKPGETRTIISSGTHLCRDKLKGITLQCSMSGYQGVGDDGKAIRDASGKPVLGPLSTAQWQGPAEIQ